MVLMHMIEKIMEVELLRSTVLCAIVVGPENWEYVMASTVVWHWTHTVSLTTVEIGKRRKGKGGL